MEKKLDPESLVRKVRRSRYPVSALAEIYRVAIKWVSETELMRLGFAYRGLRSGPSDDVAEAPMFAGGCIPWDNAVFILKSEDPGLEELLHEVVHCICYVPVLEGMQRRSGIDHVDEADFLMPFERALARACIVSPFDLEAVIKYQEDTSVWNEGRALGDYHDYESMPRWQKGLEVAKQVGLLDDALVPTFCRPDWSRISVDERRRLLESL